MLMKLLPFRRYLYESKKIYGKKKIPK